MISLLEYTSAELKQYKETVDSICEWLKSVKDMAKSLYAIWQINRGDVPIGTMMKEYTIENFGVDFPEDEVWNSDDSDDRAALQSYFSDFVISVVDTKNIPPDNIDRIIEDTYIGVKNQCKFIFWDYKANGRYWIVAGTNNRDIYQSIHKYSLNHTINRFIRYRDMTEDYHYAGLANYLSGQFIYADKGNTNASVKKLKKRRRGPAHPLCPDPGYLKKDNTDADNGSPATDTGNSSPAAPPAAPAAS